MASQGFFSFGDNFDEQIKGRFAGEKDNSDDQIASSLSSGGYGGYIDAGSRRGYVSPEQAEKMLTNPEAYKMRPSETKYLRESMGLPRANFVSPSGKEVAKFASSDPTKIALDITGSRGRGEIISGDVSDDRSGFDRYLKENYGTGIDENRYKNMPGNLQRILRESYNEEKQKGTINYREGAFLNQAKPKEEKGNILQRIAGSIFDAATFTQPAAAQPTMSNLSETGDTSFRSYRMGQDFADSIKGIGNLPSDYKSTEASAFKSARNFKEAQAIAKRNPNVSINSDGKAVATNNSARARAQAAAVNRKLSGKSMSQVKSENKQAMKDRAKARHAAFKKKRAEKKKNKKK